MTTTAASPRPSRKSARATPPARGSTRHLATPLVLLARHRNQYGIHSLFFTVEGIEPTKSPLFRLEVSPHAGIVLGVDLPPRLDKQSALITDSLASLEHARLLALGTLPAGQGYWWTLLQRDPALENNMYSFYNAVMSGPDKWALLARVIHYPSGWGVHQCLLMPPMPGPAGILPTPDLLADAESALMNASRSRLLAGVPPQELQAVIATIESARTAIIDFLIKRTEQKAIDGSISPF